MPSIDAEKIKTHNMMLSIKDETSLQPPGEKGSCLGGVESIPFRFMTVNTQQKSCSLCIKFQQLIVQSKRRTFRSKSLSLQNPSFNRR